MRTQAGWPEQEEVDRPGSNLWGLYLGKVLEVLPSKTAIRAQLEGGSHTIDAQVMAPRAHAARGWVWLPEVGELVVIAFIRGHKEMPVCLGSVYDQTDGRPTTAANVLKLKHQSGASVEVNEAGKVTLDANGSTITLNPNGKIVLEPGAGTTIELGGTVAVARHGDLTSVESGHSHTIIASSTKVKAG